MKINTKLRSSLVDYINNIKYIDINKVAIVDADSIIYAICVNKKQDENQVSEYGLQSERSLEQVIEEFNNYFFKILMDTGCNSYIALTTKGSHRYSIYKEYKANRKYLERPKYLTEITDYCINELGFIRIDGYEADDLVNIFNNLIKDDKILIHTDKDLNQIPGKHYNYKTPEFYNITSDEGAELLWKQVITGDATDNIKGIPGKGIKAAEEIFKDIKCPPARILKYYIEHFGEYKGILEFTKNYQLIKLLDNFIEPIDINLNPIYIEDILK